MEKQEKSCCKICLKRICDILSNIVSILLLLLALKILTLKNYFYKILFVTFLIYIFFGKKFAVLVLVLATKRRKMNILNLVMLIMKIL